MIFRFFKVLPYPRRMPHNDSFRILFFMLEAKCLPHPGMPELDDNDGAREGIQFRIRSFFLILYIDKSRPKMDHNDTEHLREERLMTIDRDGIRPYPLFTRLTHTMGTSHSQSVVLPQE